MLILCVKIMDKGGYQIRTQAAVLNWFSKILWPKITFLQKIWFIGFVFYLMKYLVV